MTTSPEILQVGLAPGAAIDLLPVAEDRLQMLELRRMIIEDICECHSAASRQLDHSAA